MTQLAKVQGYSNLRKNVNSGAVINIDQQSYLKNKSIRDTALKNRKEQTQVRDEIDNIKSEMQEIKSLLAALLDK